MMEMDPCERDFHGAKQVAHPTFHLGVPDIEMNFLDLDEFAQEGGIDGGDGLVFAGKTDALGAWPGEPGSHVGFPFRGHSVTEGCWSA